MKTLLRDLADCRALLTQEQRRSGYVLLVLMVVGMGLETLGVGIVIPALRLFAEPELVEAYPRINYLTHLVGGPGPGGLMIGGMIVVSCIYAVKAAFLAFVIWNSHRFAYAVESSIAERLVGRYLRQPWTFHLQRNSAELIRNVITETNLFRGDGLISGMAFVTEALVFAGITALLFIIEPAGATAMILVLGVATVMFTRGTRVYIKRWGTARQFHDKLRIQHLQQGLGGAKDVKLLGREEGFLTRFRVHNQGSAAVGRRWFTVQELPRLLIELLGVIGLTALLIVMLSRGRSVDDVLPTLGVFAVAAFRLMPSANRMLTAIQRIRYARPIVHNLLDELALPDSEAGRINRAEPLEFIREIRLEGISFSYPESSGAALEHVSLTIPRGSSIGIIGESGSGKSTLVDIILGLLPPDSGTVLVDGIDIQPRLRAWQDKLGYVPQSIFLTDDSLRRNIALGLPDDEIDEVAILRAVRDAQLDGFLASLPQGLDTVVGERGVRISGGERQRIGIARALYHDPEMLVLDEATSSLDNATEQGVMMAVRALEGRKTIIIVAHRLSTVARCERLFRIELGKIVQEGQAGVVLGVLDDEPASVKR